MNRADRHWHPPRLPTVPKATKVDGAHPVPLARPGDKLQGEFLGVRVTTPGELPDIYLQRIDGRIVSTRGKPDVLDALVGVPVGTWVQVCRVASIVVHRRPRPAAPAAVVTPPREP